MRFTKHLLSHMTPEWRSQYIAYEAMTSMIQDAVKNAPNIEHIESSEVEKYNQKFEEKFFVFCDAELKKVETFYSQKLAEATRMYSTLKSDLCELRRKVKRRKKLDENAPSKISENKIHHMQLAFSEFYLNLILLQRFQNLNYSGFENILKKYDESFKSKAGKRWLNRYVSQAHFYTNNDVNRLLSETEQTVTQYLEGGDRKRAMQRLQVPRLVEKKLPYTALKVGLLTGAFIVLATVLIISAFIYGDDIDWEVFSFLYRSPFIMTLFLVFWGFNVHSWRSAGVNHVLIFELDPRDHVEALHVVELGMVFGVLWLLSVISFIYSPVIGLPRYVNPLILNLLMLGYLFNPTKTFRHKSRFWVLDKLGRISLAPIIFVNFPDFWIGDQMCSFAIIFADFAYGACLFATNRNWDVFEDTEYCPRVLKPVNPFLMTIPFYLRFMQCFRRYANTNMFHPHFVNGIKYSMSLIACITTFLHIIFIDNFDRDIDNPLFYLRLLSLTAASTFCVYWDMREDWGVLDANAGDNFLLREEIVYPPSWYYFAMVENFIGRFLWVIMLITLELGFVTNTGLTNISSLLEAFRRFVWNFFRLENEHLNNCGLFRAVRDIHIGPIDSKDKKKIIKMMDEENGVTNRRKRVYEEVPPASVTHFDQEEIAVVG